MLRDYSFFAVYESVETELFPVVNTLVFRDNLDENTGAHRRALETELVFNNKNDSADFDFLNNIELNNPCADITFEIRYKGETKHPAIIKIGSPKVRVDVSKCHYFIKLDIDDAYTCLFKNWEKEIDILDDTSKVTVNTFIGELEVAFCTDVRSPAAEDYDMIDVPMDFCVAGQPGWVLVQHYTLQNQPDEFGNQSRFYSSRYVREKAVLPAIETPPGDEWILAIDNSPIDKTWVRSPQTSDFQEFNVYNDVSYLFFKIAFFNEELYGLDFDNGVLLAELLDKKRMCGLLPISRFFSISSDEEPVPDNSAYERAIEKLQNVVIYQKSDIKRHELGTPATDGIWTFKKLWEHLKNQFNLELRVQGVSLRMEHVSYFSKNQGLDLTVGSYAKSIKGLLSYTYDNSRVARQETWSFQEECSIDFKGKAIEYDCAGEEDNPSINFPLVDINNDVAYIVGTPDAVSDSGFIFINAYKEPDGDSYYIRSENSELSDKLTNNGHMSIPNLQYNYFRWKRPLPSGTMNGDETVFESSLNRRVQGSISVRVPADVYWNEFRPEDLIKTGFGWSEIETATYDARTCTLTITAKH